jgi:SAM-dependent methyltransferase
MNTTPASGEASSPQALYDQTAARWVRNEPSSLSDFTARPLLLELCRPLEGLRCLDLGCGEGYCTRMLRRAGAGEVLGIDVSQRMIDAALSEEERAPLGIRYRAGDATQLQDLPEGRLDLVLAVFLFNYLDRAATEACMREVRRVLRPGGRFVFAVPHPFFPLVRTPAPPFYFDVEGHDYFSGRDQRFAGKIWKRDGTELEVQVVHKTLEDYFTALQSAGFREMPTVRELRVTDDILAIDPAFFSPLLGTPLHMAFVMPR